MRAAGDAHRAAFARPASARRARRPRSCGSGPPLHEARADEGHHQLALLIGPGVARENEPPAGAAVRGALLGDLGCIGDRVAGIDRLQPFEVAKAGRRPELGERFPARRALGVLALAVLNAQPHPRRDGVPARCAQRAEMRLRGGRLVHVECLRVVLPRQTS